MKTNNVLFLVMSFFMLSGFTATGLAQEKATEATMPQIADSADMTAGEIRKIDIDNKKITIKHGEIRNLDMPGMTMVFQVNDLAFLEKFKKGDKVKFKVEKSGTAFVITEIHLIK
jgi:Cu/Ag efflux protein CusF